MKTDAPFGRADGVIVLDAVPLKHPDRPVVHLHGKMNDERAFGPLHDFDGVPGNPEMLGGSFDLLLYHFVRAVSMG